MRLRTITESDYDDLPDEDYFGDPIYCCLCEQSAIPEEFDGLPCNNCGATFCKDCLPGGDNYKNFFSRHKIHGYKICDANYVGYFNLQGGVLTQCPHCPRPQVQDFFSMPAKPIRPVTESDYDDLPDEDYFGDPIYCAGCTIPNTAVPGTFTPCASCESLYCEKCVKEFSDSTPNASKVVWEHPFIWALSPTGEKNITICGEEGCRSEQWIVQLRATGKPIPQGEWLIGFRNQLESKTVTESDYDDLPDKDEFSDASGGPWLIIGFHIVDGDETAVIHEFESFLTELIGYPMTYYAPGTGTFRNVTKRRQFNIDFGGAGDAAYDSCYEAQKLLRDKFGVDRQLDLPSGSVCFTSMGPAT